MVCGPQTAKILLPSLPSSPPPPGPLSLNFRRGLPGHEVKRCLNWILNNAHFFSQCTSRVKSNQFSLKKRVKKRRLFFYFWLCCIVWEWTMNYYLLGEGEKRKKVYWDPWGGGQHTIIYLHIYVLLHIVTYICFTYVCNFNNENKVFWLLLCCCNP